MNYPKLARRAARLAFLAVLFLAVARPAGALDDFGVTPDKKLAKALADLADVCFACGDKAKEKGLYGHARSFFDHALRYDPDHKATRKVMGFKKKKDAWVLDEDLIPLKDVINESKRQELEEKLVVETRDLRTKGVEPLWKFAADTGVPAEQRMLALFHVLRLCPEHRDAQKAARATPDVMWFRHGLDDDDDANRAKWVGRGAAGAKIEGNTPYEQALGFAMAKRKTPWFVVHCDVGEASEAWAETLSQFAEASRDHSLELLGLDKTEGPKDDAQRLHYTVFNNRDRFASFVEKCSGIEDPAQRNEVAKVSGGSETFKPYGSVWLYLQTGNDYGLRDGIAHDLGYKEITRCCGNTAYWLAHGFGYLNSTQMNGSTHARFYGVKASTVIDTGGKDALPGLGDSPAGWRLHTAMLAAGNKLLKPSQLGAVRVNDLDNSHMAQSYCYAEFLVTQHKDKFSAFLKASIKDRSKRIKEKGQPETASEQNGRLFTELGLTEDEFVTAFRAWAIANYAKLPGAAGE
ncbi:MAG: hypothetical protein IT463_12120 [Planctomycetes bacterium]|nr:hypothetical protein [Planctomycetota bacterium]